MISSTDNDRMNRMASTIQIYGDRKGYWVSSPFLDILELQFKGLNIDFQLKQTYQGLRYLGFIADKETSIYHR